MTKMIFWDHRNADTSILYNSDPKSQEQEKSFFILLTSAVVRIYFDFS